MPDQPRWKSFYVQFVPGCFVPSFVAVKYRLYVFGDEKTESKGFRSVTKSSMDVLRTWREKFGIFFIISEKLVTSMLYRL
jgi:hypothetical protein